MKEQGGRSIIFLFRPPGYWRRGRASKRHGHGLPFRENMFDGAISVGAIQWLCYRPSTSGPRRNVSWHFSEACASSFAAERELCSSFIPRRLQTQP